MIPLRLAVHARARGAAHGKRIGLRCHHSTPFVCPKIPIKQICPSIVRAVEPCADEHVWNYKSFCNPFVAY